MMARISAVLVLAYAAMLCVVGAAGIVSAHWELTQLFHLPLDQQMPEVRATFLNQYRFLKAIELAAGIACLASRQAILEGGLAGTLFLILVASGVVARSIAWIVDGTPAPVFLVFLALELLVFVVTLLHLRTRPAHG